LRRPGRRGALGGTGCADFGLDGREEFEITDCVFIGDDAVAKYFIHFVPNTEDFELEFKLEVPDDAPIW
jgi:hypothetical protein